MISIDTQIMPTILITFDCISKLEINNKMSKSPEPRIDENPERTRSKPKRRVEKSLPIIQNKKVPLHQIQSNKMHVDMSEDHRQPTFWAYVPFPSKKIQSHKKSNSSLSAKEATLELNNSSVLLDPSRTLLDKYFQRKHQTKLKDVIKFIEETTDYASDSIGYEQISIFQNIIKKRQTTMTFFQQTKRIKKEKMQSLFDQTVKEKIPKRNIHKKRFQSFIEGYNNSEIDNYFTDDKKVKARQQVNLTWQ